MSTSLVTLALTISIGALSGCNETGGLKNFFQAKELSPDAARTLAAMPFDSSAAVTVHGRLTTLEFPLPGTNGMIVVHPVEGTSPVAFSTAATRDMAQQGFTRFSIKPGQEVVVTGVLTRDGQKIEGAVAARADTIASPDGRTLFRRSAVQTAAVQ